MTRESESPENSMERGAGQTALLDIKRTPNVERTQVRRVFVYQALSCPGNRETYPRALFIFFVPKLLTPV